MSATSFLANGSAIFEDRPGFGWAERIRLLTNQAVAVLLLVIASPLMLCIAAFIWSCDGAPVLFGHYRVGRRGLLFKCLKFRTMASDAESRLALLLASDPQARAQWERDHKLVNDPRITFIGRFLRRTSLDELPQLVNVLCGEMSLVGPRPVTVDELKRYGAARWHYLSVTPGLTGLWQVSGRNDLSYEQRVQLDRHYIDHRSIGLDLLILLRTVRVVMLRAGAR